LNEAATAAESVAGLEAAGWFEVLSRRMIEDMTIRNRSPATAIQQSYVHAVSKFSQYFGRSPDRLGLEDVRSYQVHLASKASRERR
jgi:Phage integrase, N-terminal SAM-like domain